MKFFLKIIYRFKAPIVDENCEEITKFCEEAVSYFTDLQVWIHDKARKTQSLHPISNSQIKTGFIGLRACLRNLPAIRIKMREFSQGGFLTYPLLQDHLEFFFGEIRTKLGCNTNPTIYQFRAILKRLLTCVQMGNLLDNTNCKTQTGVIPTLHVEAEMKVCTCFNASTFCEIFIMFFQPNNEGNIFLYISN